MSASDDAKVAIVTRQRLGSRTIDFQKSGFPPPPNPTTSSSSLTARIGYFSLIGANRVVKIDRQGSIVAQYEMETPGMLALAGENRLIVSRSMSAVNPPKRIAILDRTKMTGEEIEVLFARPHPVAATLAGYAYTGSLGVNQIASVELVSQRVSVSNLEGSIHSLVQFATTRDGKTLVATGDASGKVLVLDLTTPASPKLVKAIDVGKMAFDPVFTPDERACRCR